MDLSCLIKDTYNTLIHKRIFWICRSVDIKNFTHIRLALIYKVFMVGV